MSVEVLEMLDKQIKQRRGELERFIAGGTIKDFNEYHRLCGVIQGLDAVHMFINDLANRLEYDADE